MSQQSITYTLRVPAELEPLLSICPGDSRTERVLNCLKFAFENGYPGTEIQDHSQTELIDRIKELEDQVGYLIRFMQRVKDLEEKGKQWHFALEKHQALLDKLTAPTLPRRIGT